MLNALAQSVGEAAGLTAIPGIRVGHDTLSARPPGYTGDLLEDGNAFLATVSLLRTTALSNLKSENTTIGIVATNSTLTKPQLGVVARMSHDRLARVVRPAHTPSDGDAIFAIATGSVSGDVSLLQVGALAADATAEAIVRAVRTATGLSGYPSARDLQGGVR